MGTLYVVYGMITDVHTVGSRGMGALQGGAKQIGGGFRCGKRFGGKMKSKVRRQPNGLQARVAVTQCAQRVLGGELL